MTTATRTIDLTVTGMDCAACATNVERALATLPGVGRARVSLGAEKAVVIFDPTRASEADLRRAIEAAGYACPLPHQPPRSSIGPAASFISNRVLQLFGIVLGGFLLLVVAAEWLGLFERVNDRLPRYAWLAAVVVAGYPVFRGVLRASLRRQVTSHTLMTVGVLAAILVGEWTAAIIVIFFMRVASYTEHFTLAQSRRALKQLTSLASQTARVLRGEREHLVPIGEVKPGDVVVVRPGERIPVDGIVTSGRATVDRAAITGEAMPVEAHPGTPVHAATLAQLGSLRVQTTRVGPDSTFGRVIRLVEEAETNRAGVQQLADKVSSYYLPVIAAVALATFVVGRDPLATAAVLLVACSCAFAMATPIAVLASIGTAAKRGLLIKGGKYLEALARADLLLVDKTGTLTHGKPELTDIHPLGSIGEAELLTLAASVESDSEHPLAEAVRNAAAARHLTLRHPRAFEVLPGQGVQGLIDERAVKVGSYRLLSGANVPGVAREFEAQGKALLFVLVDDELVGVLAAADTLRGDVPKALTALRHLGITHIELLTGDHERTARTLAGELGIRYRANLLPEDKIAIVKRYQAEGRTVVMIGDGVNDAPALVQADVGVAMGVAGTDVALEAAPMALMLDDWSLVPEAFRIARRTLRVITGNLAFTIAYNAVGVSLAAFGLLPPIFAAAAQSLPDVGIMANSARLLRHPPDTGRPRPAGRATGEATPKTHTPIRPGG